MTKWVTIVLTEEEKIAREEKRRKKEEKKKRKQECLIQEEKKRQQEEQKRKDLMENLFDINLYKKVYLKSSILELNVCEECGGELKLEHKGIFDEERKIHQIQYKKCDLCNTAYVKCPAYYAIPKELRNMMIIDEEIRNNIEKYGITMRKGGVNVEELDDGIYMSMRKYCTLCYSQVNKVNANTIIVTDKGIENEEMDIFQCRECKKYGMIYTEYNRLRDIGNILCDVYYLKSDFTDSLEIKTKIKKIASKEYLKNKQIYDSNCEKIVDFDFNSENKILIRASKSDIESGELKDILARVKVIKKNGDIVELEFPAAFCVVRGKFYIHESVYKKIRNNGIPQCRIVETSNVEDGREKLSFKEWNEESILHMYGYNVSSTENLSDKQRQIILYSIIANNVLQRWQIVDHISLLVSLNKGKRNWENAVEKWRKDIEYVNSIDISNLDKKIPDVLNVKKRIRI